MLEKITFILEKLNNFKEELNGIYNLAHNRSDRDLGNQKFIRWKERIVLFLEKNISGKEAKECKDLSYPMVMESSKFQNFDSKIKAYNAYLEILNDELKSNPDFLFREQKKLSKKIISKEEKIKVFISYSTADKERAHQISQKLKDWGLDVFLAHEDIEVSEEWKEIILENLLNCHVFIPLITENFKNSNWTSQEIGIAFARGKDIFIVPLKKGDFIPFGFISHIQAKDIDEDRFELSIIRKIENKYPKSLIDRLMDYLYKSGSFREAEFRLKFILECIGEPLNKETLNMILKIALENKRGQILNATECKKWLVEHLKDKEDIDKNIFKKFKDLSEYKNEL